MTRQNQEYSGYQYTPGPPMVQQYAQGQRQAMPQQFAQGQGQPIPQQQFVQRQGYPAYQHPPRLSIDQLGIDPDLPRRYTAEELLSFEPVPWRGIRERVKCVEGPQPPQPPQLPQPPQTPQPPQLLVPAEPVPDHYRTLGVKQNATYQQIDKAKDDILNMINVVKDSNRRAMWRAHEVLSDPEARESYDEKRKYGYVQDYLPYEALPPKYDEEYIRKSYESQVKGNELFYKDQMKHLKDLLDSRDKALETEKLKAIEAQKAQRVAEDALKVEKDLRMDDRVVQWMTQVDAKYKRAESQGKATESAQHSFSTLSKYSILLYEANVERNHASIKSKENPEIMVAVLKRCELLDGIVGSLKAICDGIIETSRMCDFGTKTTKAQLAEYCEAEFQQYKNDNEAACKAAEQKAKEAERIEADKVAAILKQADENRRREKADRKKTKRAQKKADKKASKSRMASSARKSVSPGRDSPLTATQTGRVTKSRLPPKSKGRSTTVELLLAENSVAEAARDGLLAAVAEDVPETTEEAAAATGEVAAHANGILGELERESTLRESLPAMREEDLSPAPYIKPEPASSPPPRISPEPSSPAPRRIKRELSTPPPPPASSPPYSPSWN